MNLGKMSVILSASPAMLYKGLQEAQSKIASFASVSGRLMLGVGRRLNSAYNLTGFKGLVGVMTGQLYAGFAAMGSSPLVALGITQGLAGVSKIFSGALGMVFGSGRAIAGLGSIALGLSGSIVKALGITAIGPMIAGGLSRLWLGVSGLLATGARSIWSSSLFGVIGQTFALGWRGLSHLLVATGVSWFAGQVGSRLQAVWTMAAAAIGPGLTRLFGGLGGVAMGAGKILAGTIGVALGGLALAAGLAAMSPDLFKKAADSIKSLGLTGLKAKSIGVLSDDFMALSNNAKRFGLEGEDVEKILFKIAALPTPKGIDAEKWMKSGTMARFGILADDIKALPTANEQAARSFELLSKQGQKALILFQQGSKGIDEFRDKQRALGLAITQPDMDKIIRARSVLPKFGAVFDGLQNRLVIAVAPLIEVFANIMQQAMPAVIAIANFAAEAMAHWYTNLAILWEMVFSWLGEMGSEIYKVLSALGDVNNFLPSMEKVFDVTFRFIGKVVAYVFDTIKAGLGAIMFAVAELFKVVGQGGTAMGFSWGKAMATAGEAFSKVGAKWVLEWGQSAGNVDAFFDMVLARNKKLGDQAGEMAQKIQAQYSAVGAAVFGSKEALSIEARFKTGQLTDPKLDVEKKQLDEQKRTNEILKEVKGIIGGMKAAGDLVFGVI